MSINVIPANLDRVIDAQRLLQQVIDQQYVVLVGSPITGFGVIGPFASRVAASDYLDVHDREGWVLQLSAPPNVGTR
jgi:hypothetical protein